MHGLSGQQPSPTIRQLTSIVPGIKKQFGVIRIGIFGSVARGDQKSSSDVDLLVDLTPDHKTLKNFVALVDYLETLLKRRVDLVTVEGLDPYIKSHVEDEVIWIEG